MSLLLDALRRSEVLSQTEPQTRADPFLSASAGPAPAPVSTTDANQQAAQTLMQASSSSKPKEGRRHWRWLVLMGLVLVLSAGAWMGWEWWSSMQQPSGIVARSLPPRSSLPSETPVAESPSPSPSPETPVEPANATAPTTIATSAPAMEVPLPALTPTSSIQAVPVPPPPRDVPHAKPAPTVASASNATAGPPVVSAAPANVPDKPTAAPPRDRSSAPTAPKLELVKSQTAEKVQQAWGLLQKGDFSAAEHLYRQALQEKNDEPDAALGLAVALHRQKKLDEAWAAYQRSMQLWPDNPTAQTGMLSILTETDAQTAVGRLQEWIAARPRDAAAHAALAKLWAKQGKWSEALPLLQRAMSLEPHQGSYIFNLAVVYDQLHRYPEAVSHYRMALQSGSTGIPMSTIQARLLQLEEQKSP